MMNRVKFTNIVWDKDGEQVELPTEAILAVSNDVDLDDEGADLLSDEFGWCVLSFSWEKIDW